MIIADVPCPILGADYFAFCDGRYFFTNIANYTLKFRTDVNHMAEDNFAEILNSFPELTETNLGKITGSGQTSMYRHRRFSAVASACRPLHDDKKSLSKMNSANGSKKA